MKIVKREKSTSTRGHYVTNAQLLPAVIEARGLSKVTDKLAKMILMIAERYSRKSNFINYSFREDMVSAAMANLCNNALKFDPEKSSNPFSFYTTAIHNSFLQYMADEKKHRMIRDQLLVEAGANPSFNFSSGDSEEVKASDDVSFGASAPVVEDEDDKQTFIKEIVDPETGAKTKKEIDSRTGKEVIKSKIVKHRYESRQPGEVTVLKVSDYVLDPVTNTYVKKVVEEEAKPAKKKAAAKKVK